MDRFCHKNSARHRFGDDKMFNFTKPFERNRLVVRKRIRSLHDNLYLYDCILCVMLLLIVIHEKVRRDNTQGVQNTVL